MGEAEVHRVGRGHLVKAVLASCLSALPKIVKFGGYSLVTLLPALIALYTVSWAVPGLSRNDKNVPLPELRFGPPAASSYRQDHDLTAHSPTNLLDGNEKTFWSECKANRRSGFINDGSSRRPASECAKPAQKRISISPGKFSGTPPKADRWVSGESVTLPLTEPTTLKAISVRNGDEYSQREYYRNPRAKHLLIQAWTCDDVSRWPRWMNINHWSCGHPNSGEPDTCFVQYLPDEEGFQTFGSPTYTGAASNSIDCKSATASSKGLSTPAAAGVRPESGSLLMGATQVRMTVVDAYDGEDQFPDQDALTGSDSASTDLIISDVQLIPSTLPR